MQTPTLRLFTPVIQGPPEFVTDLSARAEGWRRTIRMQGGYWLGEFRLRGERSFLERFFHEYLGFHLVETSGGDITWEGLLYDIELTTAGSGVTRRRSLGDMANDVWTTYVDPEDRVLTSTHVTNTASVARYGRRQELLLLDGFSQAAAELRRDTFLNENAWPWARPVGYNGQVEEDELVVMAAGYIFTAGWLYESIGGLDGNQGALAYAGDRFVDGGQDFADWETTSGAARYSIWVKNDDGSVSWGWLGATVSATEVRVYQDADRTTPGWNGDDPTGKTPESYSIYGPVSEWVEDVLTQDCPFLQIGKVTENLLHSKSENKIDLRAWDILTMLTELGGSGGEPWRLYCGTGRRVYYEPVDTTPAYYLRGGGVYSSIGGALAVNPWVVRPGVVRDIQYPVGLGEPGGWLLDRRDFYALEVEAGMDLEGPVFHPVLFDESDVLAAQQAYTKLLERRAADDKKKAGAADDGKSKTKGRRWKNK